MVAINIMLLYMVLVYFTGLANLGIFFFLTIETGLLQRARKEESDAKLEIPTTLPKKRGGVSTFISLYPFAACPAHLNSFVVD